MDRLRTNTPLSSHCYSWLDDNKYYHLFQSLALTHKPILSTHSIWAALQQDVDGSVNIPITVMQCDHRLILVLACDVNQLEKVERETKR